MAKQTEYKLKLLTLYKNKSNEKEMVTKALVGAGTIVAYGALLGFGFWTSRKFTDYIDVKLAEREAMKYLNDNHPKKEKATELYKNKKEESK